MTRSHRILLLLAIACAGTTATSAVARPVQEWTLATGNVTMSPPRFVDVDANGTQEIVFATMGPIGNPFSAGFVYVVDLGGNALPGFPIQLSQPITGGALAIGDVDASGDVEIVAQGWFFTYVWNHDGTNLAGWPKSTGTGSSISPALADLDDDGDLEIIAPIGAAMHAWHHTGAAVTGWPKIAPESFQAASIGDVDGDGQVEVVAGTWRPQFPDQVPFELYMWKANGAVAPGFPVGSLGSVRGPVGLADLDGDGSIELVVRAGDSLHVFDSSGAPVPGWPVVPGGPTRNATPAVGDLDEDGDLEIVIGGFDVYAYHHDGTPVSGWPVDVPTTGNMNSAAAIASIDADTAAEVIVKTVDHVTAIDGDGTVLPGFPFVLSDDNQSATFSPSPLVGDPDGDGEVEYAFLSVSGTLVYFDEAQPHAPAAAYWPMFQHDVNNSSFLSPPGGNGSDAALMDFQVVKGTHLGGGLPEIEDSDDEYLTARSEVGFSAFEPNVMDVVIGAMNTNPSPFTIDLVIESRINNPNGTAKLRLKRWKTEMFEQVDQYPIQTTEETHVTSGIEAVPFIRDADRRMELSIRHVVIATFSPLGFDSFLDLVRITVN